MSYVLVPEVHTAQDGVHGVLTPRHDVTCPTLPFCTLFLSTRNRRQVVSAVCAHICRTPRRAPVRPPAQVCDQFASVYHTPCTVYRFL